MAPTSKGKAGGVSVGSFFELKSELAKQADEFSRNKAISGPKYVVGETKKNKVCMLTYTPKFPTEPTEIRRLCI